MTTAIFHRVAFLLEEDVCRELEALVPLAQRHRVVNAALRRELELLRQQSESVPPELTPSRNPKISLGGR